MPDLKSVSTELPNPPYPPETRADGREFVLDLDRLYVSRSWVLASAEQRPWMLLMLAESWRSIPIASFPNDREVIAARLGVRREFLEAHAKTLLCDWVEHSDGRLYHKALIDVMFKEDL